MYKAVKNELITLHQEVAAAAVDFENNGLISLRSEENQCYVIKSASVSGDQLTEIDIMVLDSEARVIDGNSKNMDKRFYTHYEIYKAFPHINSIVQLDTRWCGIWSQTSPEVVPPLSALHARNFFGEIPITKALNNEYHENIYAEIGQDIVALFEKRPARHVQAALIYNMGGIAFGTNGTEAVHTALVLEEVVARAWHTRQAVNGQFRYIPYVLMEELFQK